MSPIEELDVNQAEALELLYLILSLKIQALILEIQGLLWQQNLLYREILVNRVQPPNSVVPHEVLRGADFNN